MKKESWFWRNFVVIVAVVWGFLGIVMINAFLSAFSWNAMSKFPAMVWVGTAFGFVGFRLAIVLEKRGYGKP